MKRVILLCVAAILFGTVSYAHEDYRRAHLIDSLSGRLPLATTYIDSVNILYDLFDLQSLSEKKASGMELLALASAHDDESVQFDITRLMASSLAVTDTAICTYLLKYVKGMPEGRERNATESFVFLSGMRGKIYNAGEDERQKNLSEYLHRYKSSTELSPREEMEMLYVICSYMDMAVPGDMLVKYIGKLGEAIERLPFHLDAIDNMFYQDASIVFGNFGDAERSVYYSRKLLQVIESLARQSREDGRKYRDYSSQYYNAYRRLLSNYPFLTEDEVDSYYSKILDLTKISVDCNYDFNNSQRPSIYYMMAKKRYPEALEILEKQVDNPYNELFVRHLYKLMSEAANAVGDKDAMLRAAMGYNDVLEYYLRQSSLERSREIKAVYDFGDIQAEKADMEQKNREEEMDRRQVKYMIILASAIVLLIGLILFLTLYQRARRLSQRLSVSNAILVEQRDNLQHIQKDLIEARDRARKADRHKTDFIHNMSHEVKTPLNAIVEYSHLIVDNMSEEKRKYIDKYARIVELSADMLRTLVDDVLDIASMDNGTGTPVSINTTSVKALCEVAVDSVRKYKPEGVELRFANDDIPDKVINTDAKRVEQVLINLLTNGLKFTEEGYVELSYKVDTGTDRMVFVVTDTGIGIPDGKEEMIFERFVKLSSLSQGLGLGLNICRLIAERLGGEVKVDTTYAGPGSRFIFSVPM